MDASPLQHDFLAKLRELGGTAGNQSLQGALGWDDDQYEQTRAQLLSPGAIALGRGRGGSVKLPEDSAIVPAVRKRALAAAAQTHLFDPSSVLTAPAADPGMTDNDANEPSKRRNSTGVVKKSDLYSSIWASCDELRGGMDASQYKDYVLFMLL